MSHLTERWEYHLLPNSPEPTVEALNALGREGWELVMQTGPIGDFIFKRRAPGFREQITLDQRARVQAEQGTAE